MACLKEAYLQARQVSQLIVLSKLANRLDCGRKESHHPELSRLSRVVT